MVSTHEPSTRPAVIDEICALNWQNLNPEETVELAWAFSYFSTQFRENLEIACRLHPDDENLKQLKREECHTDNLSPWPDVAAPGEKMNHDEFMRRLLALSPIDRVRRERIAQLGGAYCKRIRAFPEEVRAASIASYEGELDDVFRAMLRAPRWELPVLGAFKYFLEKHIAFDSEPCTGHGALCRHLKIDDDGIVPLWKEFKQLLVDAVPRLRSA